MRSLPILLLFLFCGANAQKTEVSPIVYEGDTLDLVQTPILLSEVVVGSNSISAEELIAQTKKVMAKAINQTTNTSLQYFLRHSDIQHVEVDFKLKKSTVSEIDASFVERLKQSIPSYSSSHLEGLYTTSLTDTTPKVITRFEKGFQLLDEPSTVAIDDIEDILLGQIERSVAAGHFFKIKSGIFGTKIREEDIDLDEIRSANDSTKNSVPSEEDLKQRHRFASAMGYQRYEEISGYQLYDPDPMIELFEKPQKFDLQIVDNKWYRDQWVHVVAFRQKSGDEFYGELWINETDKGLVQFKFVNNKPVRSIKLLGFSYRIPRVQGQYFYRKLNENHQFFFGRLEKDSEVGVDRPLSLIEKRKATFGGKKVNRVDLDINFNLKQTEEFTYIFKNTDENVVLKESDLTAYPVMERLETYPIDFWKDTEFSIAPSEAMKQFKITKPSSK